MRRAVAPVMIVMVSFLMVLPRSMMTLVMLFILLAILVMKSGMIWMPLMVLPMNHQLGVKRGRK
jgi:hypothetical protein